MNRPPKEQASGPALLAVAGYAVLVQLMAGTLVVALGPWPWLGWLTLTAYAAFLFHACRHRELLPGLGGWRRRALAVVLWQGPALVFGGWNLAAFLGWCGGMDIGCTVLQAWHAVILPLSDLVPRGEWRLVAWYLWLASAWPLVLAAILVLASRRRAVT